MEPSATCWDNKPRKTPATEFLAPHLGGAPGSARGFGEVFPEEVTLAALGFEKWIEVQDEEEFPSVMHTVGVWELWAIREQRLMSTGG